MFGALALCLCSDEELTLETSASALYSVINLTLIHRTSLIQTVVIMQNSKLLALLEVKIEVRNFPQSHNNHSYLALVLQT